MLKNGVAAWLGTCVVAGTIVASGGVAHASAASCLATYGKVAVAGQTPGWRVVESTKPSATTAGYFQASVVSGPSNLWLFPGCGQALHYSGGEWQAVPLPAGAAAEITVAAASSPSDVWAFTSSGQALFWNGRTWALKGSTGTAVSAAAAAGPDAVWVAGGTSIWYFNGQTWKNSHLPFAASALSAAPGGSLWATGGAGKSFTPVVARLTGASWTVTSMARFLPGLVNEFCEPVVNAISAQGPDSVWAVGGSNCQDNKGQVRAILHWTGGSWTALAYHGDAGQATSIAPDGSGGLWISTVTGVLAPSGMLRVTGEEINSWRLPLLDGTGPAVLLDGVPGGDGPAFGAGSYIVTHDNEGLPGSVVIEQR
jgi:hypothetical protein